MKRFTCDQDQKHPLSTLVGRSVFIRTATYHLVGRVAGIAGDWAALEDASWVADSGRFANAIEDGTLSEVEPVGDAYVNLQSVTDIFPWCHDLPKEQK